MKTLTLLLAYMLLFTSCSTIMNAVMGVNEKDIAKIKKSAEKYGFPDSLIVYIKDPYYFYSELDKLGGIPEVKVYNTQGFFVPYKEAKLCNADAFPVLDSLCTKQNFVADTTLKIADELSRMVSLSGNPVKIDSGYTVFIYWATWAMWLNKDHVAVWLKSLQKQSCNINILLVNMDLLKPNLRKPISDDSTLVEGVWKLREYAAPAESVPDAASFLPPAPIPTTDTAKVTEPQVPSKPKINPTKTSNEY